MRLASCLGSEFCRWGRPPADACWERGEIRQVKGPKRLVRRPKKAPEGVENGGSGPNRLVRRPKRAPEGVENGGSNRRGIRRSKN